MNWKKATCTAWFGMFLIGLLGDAHCAGAATTDADPPGYERLQPGAAWCAPRALYFLARYCGKECSLESAVAACGSDDAGQTTLAGLVAAAETLRLEPRAIHCASGELARISGPAIIALGENDADVHFVGLVRRDEQGKARVIDPSMSVTPFWVTNEKLAERFAGYAVVLRGCTRPSRTWHWSAPLLSVLVVAFGLLVVFSAWRFVGKRRTVR